MCEACGLQHEDIRRMSDPELKECPHCREPYGSRFNRDFTGARLVGIVYGEPKTFGQQAELNAKRLGKERVAQMAEESRNKVAKFQGKMPRGGRLPGAGPGPRVPWFHDESVDTRKIKDKRKYIETGEVT